MNLNINNGKNNGVVGNNNFETKSASMKAPSKIRGKIIVALITAFASIYIAYINQWLG